MLDLEAELGNPATTSLARASCRSPTACWPSGEADLVVVSCWSALQYSTAVAVAERARRQVPDAVIAACGTMFGSPGRLQRLRTRPSTG